MSQLIFASDRLTNQRKGKTTDYVDVSEDFLTIYSQRCQKNLLRFESNRDITAIFLKANKVHLFSH